MSVRDIAVTSEPICLTMETAMSDTHKSYAASAPGDLLEAQK